ncbi:MAG: PEGA domain-containing protein, partial [Planctomycetota bacterium]
RLKGGGEITISTRCFPCSCLSDGRTVSPDEMDAWGYHPLSGRALDIPNTAESLLNLEFDEPTRLKVHGTARRTDTLDNADVWLFRYEEIDKIFVPEFPVGMNIEEIKQRTLPEPILDRLFERGSPYRPKEGLYIGKTPVTRSTIPMGSYLLILYKDGFHPVRFPLYISRLAQEEICLTLFRNGEIPSGFIQVPEGKFIYQGDKENPYSGPKEMVSLEDCFISKYPVTCREYLEFLNDVAAGNPEKARKHAPRKSPTANPYWPHDEEGKFYIPTEKWIYKAGEQ